jgi:pyrroline-5-carboxylate reductase
MAGALAAAITRRLSNAQIMVYDVDGARLAAFVDTIPRALAMDGNAQLAPGPEEGGAEVLFLAVKPQALPQVLPEIADAPMLVISIAAGVSLATLEAALPQAHVVRVMPNTPCLVGKMAGGYACGSRITDDDRSVVSRLLSTAGTVFELPEAQLDVVTGLSGSGPAFVAQLIQAFADAGHRDGLPREVADRLALATFEGTAVLLREAELTPEKLVTMVSSKGGTTVAGRAVLEASDVHDVIGKTVRAAAERSRELGRASEGAAEA